MKTNLFRYLAAAAAVLTLAGCAPMIPNDAGTVRDIYDMKQMMADSTKRQELIDAKITSSLTSIENKVDSCPNVQPAVDDLAKMVRDQQTQITQMNQQMQAMMVVIDSLAKRWGVPGVSMGAQPGMTPLSGQTPAPSEDQAQPMSGATPAVQAFNTAAQMFNNGQYDQAREGFRQALEQNPTADQRVEIQYWQAVNYMKANDGKAAEEAFLSLIKANQKHERAWSSFEKLAQIRRQAGDLDTALNYYKNIVDIYPEYPGIQRVRDAMAQIEAEKAAKGGATPTH